MTKTFIPTRIYTKKKWYEIDCKDKKLGRIASLCALLLSGKLKCYYHPAYDVGDYVILKNVEFLTFDKKIKKFHVYVPGHPGGSFKQLVNALPELIIKKSIFGMLPNCVAKKHLTKRLKIYQGSTHPHLAQTVIKINNLENFFTKNEG